MLAARSCHPLLEFGTSAVRLRNWATHFPDGARGNPNRLRQRLRSGADILGLSRRTASAPGGAPPYSGERPFRLGDVACPNAITNSRNARRISTRSGSGSKSSSASSIAPRTEPKRSPITPQTYWRRPRRSNRFGEGRKGPAVGALDARQAGGHGGPLSWMGNGSRPRLTTPDWLGAASACAGGLPPT